MALAVLLSGQVAWAEPAAITQAKSEAQALSDRVDELADQLDAAVEDYNYAQAQLADTQDAAKQAQTKLTKAESDLDGVRAQLSQRVVEIYKQGHLSSVGMLAEASSFSDLVNRFSLLERLSKQDTEMLAAVVHYRDEVSQRKNELAAKLEDEKTLTAQTQAAKNKVQQQLAANEKALQGKEAQIAQLQKEEAIRQAKLAAAAKAAAEKAAKAAAEKKAKLAAAAKAAAKAKAKSKSSNSSNSGSSGGSSGGDPPSSAIGSDAVSVAMKYLGTPYVWAGASPSGFDCSGFVMYVYAKLGVSLPHSSRLQFNYGEAVSRSNLEPGDLVFFYSPIHHVGIYVGDGNMIHAAGTGKDVRIGSVWTSAYAGARRILP